MKPFRRRGDSYVARLDAAEAGVLALLLDELDQLLAGEREDAEDDDAPAHGVEAQAVLTRLLPDGHRGDARLAADYRELTRASLVSGKAEDLATVRATLPAEGGPLRLDGDQAAAWLRTTNDLRLALGTRAGVSADSEPPEDVLTETDQQLAVYYWLTAVQGSLVDSLAAGRADRR